MKLSGKKKRYRKAKSALIVCAVIVVGFLTWLTIKVATESEPVEVELNEEATETTEEPAAPETFAPFTNAP